MAQAAVLLQGPRVTLRDVRPGDVEAVHSFASDPVVTQWSTWGPNAMEETQFFIDDAVAETAALPAEPRARFTLAVLFEGQVVGTAGVWTSSASDRNGELGYTLCRGVWGRGLATEAAALLLDHAFGAMELKRVEATCHPENTGSVRVLEKNGFVFEGRLREHRVADGKRRDSLLFAALLSDRLPDKLAAGSTASLP